MRVVWWWYGCDIWWWYGGGMVVVRGVTVEEIISI